jgi:hypothetical protein
MDAMVRRTCIEQDYKERVDEQTQLLIRQAAAGSREETEEGGETEAEGGGARDAIA